MALEAEDRTEDLVDSKSKPRFEGVQSIAQMPRKDAGTCRMVVEFPFHFSKEFLIDEGLRHGRYYPDGVDYLRRLKGQFEQGDIGLGDIENLSLEHSDNGVRVEAAK